MSTPAHLSQGQLLDYWLHDTDAASTDAVDDHLMRCEACGQALDEFIALGSAVRQAFDAGLVTAATTQAFVQGLADRGLRVREYRVPRNGSVHCTVAPEDQLLVSRLEAPLQGVLRVDALAALSLSPDAPQRFDDIPFDAAGGEVLLLPSLAQVRQLPAHTLRITLQAHTDRGLVELGHYDFHHRPWQDA
jgi:hypothetical protein